MPTIEEVRLATYRRELAGMGEKVRELSGSCSTQQALFVAYFDHLREAIKADLQSNPVIQERQEKFPISLENAAAVFVAARSRDLLPLLQESYQKEHPNTPPTGTPPTGSVNCWIL